MAFATVNGTNLYYTEAGTGEPLLLIHGTGFNADVWDKVLIPLSQHNRTIAYDRRGYQRSQGAPSPAAGYGAQQGEDIAALILALNAGPATLLGWSAGGVYSLHTALKHPSLVKRMILYEPPLYATRYLDPSVIFMFTKLNLLKALGNKRAAASAFVRWVLTYKDGRNSADHFSDELRTGLAQDSETLLAELGGGAGEELSPDSLKAGIKMPVTLLLGAQSPQVIHRMVHNLAGIIQAPVVPLPHSNHLAQIDQPEEFVAVVRKCLG